MEKDYIKWCFVYSPKSFILQLNCCNILLWQHSLTTCSQHSTDWGTVSRCLWCQRLPIVSSLHSRLSYKLHVPFIGKLLNLLSDIVKKYKARNLFTTNTLLTSSSRDYGSNTITESNLNGLLNLFDRFSVDSSL